MPIFCSSKSSRFAETFFVHTVTDGRLLLNPMLRWLAAELLIVVLGVMIALAVDQWRESQSDRATERLYLTRILTEVRGDSANLDRIEHGLIQKDLALAAVYRSLSGKRPAPTDTTRLGSSASFGWAIPRQAPAAYAEMGTTGAL